MPKFFVADLETKGYMGKFLLGGFYDGKKYKEFKKQDDFFNFLLKQKGICFFHYADYDLRYLYDWVQRKKIKADVPVVVKGKVVAWKIKNVLFRDSFVLLPASIKELAESFELKIKKLPVEDYQKLRRGKFLSQYLKNDVIILYQVLKKFYDFLGKKYLDKPTLASIAIEKFKEMFPENYKKIVEIPIWNDEFIREGYYGVYNKAFKRVIKKDDVRILKIDVNSFYGYQMMANPFPYGDYLMTKNPEKFIEKGYLGMVRAKAYCSKRLKLGILPVKTEKGTEFPTKKWIEGVWTTPEIQFAKENGYKIKLKEGIFWENKDYLFKDYIEYLAKIKENSTGAKKEIAKQLLVAFYGKFGQRREIEIIKRVKEPETGKMYLDKNLTLMHDFQYKRAPFFHPEISAFTTAYARIFIWKFCQEIGWKNILAIMADSLIIFDNLSADFKKKWFDQKRIGKFKIIGELKKAILLAPGVYAIKLTNGEEIIRNQGGVKEFNKLLTFKDFENVIKKKKKKWLQYSNLLYPEGFKTILKKRKRAKELKPIKREIKVLT